MLKGSKTAENLMKSFAGECQARTRYTYYSSIAKKEGYIQIANIFMETAEQEKEHAKIFLKFLKSEYNDEEIEIKASYPVALHEETKNNLMKAADGETDLYGVMWKPFDFDSTKRYPIISCVYPGPQTDNPQFAQIAKKEGFNKIAMAYEKIAKIEARHERRYRRLLNNMENDTLFKKDETVFWKCNNCGYIYEGKEAPKVSPACLHLQGYFELFIENY